MRERKPGEAEQRTMHQNQSTSREGYARPDLLAEPGWVESVRNDPKVCIVDCGTGHDPKWAYIPGAVPLRAHFSLKDLEDPVHVMRPAAFADLMGSLGVTDDTTVVAYDRHGGMAAARLWWVLQHYGHPAARVLNGGWHRWRAEGRSVALRPAEREPARFTARPDEAVLARKEYVQGRLGHPDVQILDLRNRSEWQGHNPWGNRHPGHIPGAVHWEWVNSLTRDERRMFRPAAELRQEVQAAGLDPAKEVITHCQAGVRASHGAFVLNLLGFPRVRNYEASMKEWANTDDAALVVDPSPAEPTAAGPTP